MALVERRDSAVGALLRQTQARGLPVLTGDGDVVVTSDPGDVRALLRTRRVSAHVLPV